MQRIIPQALPFTVYPKKTKMLLVFLLCAAFVAIGVLMIREGHTIAWFFGAFFALGILVSLIQFIPGSSFLTVSEDGIEFCALFRRHRLRWWEISEFGVYRTGHTNFVGFNYAPEYRRASKTGAVVRRVLGYEAALPDTYGFRADELAELLSRYHAGRVER